MNVTPTELKTFCKIFDCDVLYRGEQRLGLFNRDNEKIPRFEATK